ncbi:MULTISPECIES: hypothetical protein [unclassified Paenibacillus]|nr:hypothetical protein [Paenibacillus sp. FSL H7-0357]
MFMVVLVSLLLTSLIACSTSKLNDNRGSAAENNPPKKVEEEITAEPKDEELGDLLARSNGDWIDDSYNLTAHDDAENSINIYSEANDDLSGTVCFFLALFVIIVVLLDN